MLDLCPHRSKNITFANLDLLCVRQLGAAKRQNLSKGVLSLQLLGRNPYSNFYPCVETAHKRGKEKDLDDSTRKEESIQLSQANTTVRIMHCQKLCGNDSDSNDDEVVSGAGKNRQRKTYR